VRDTDRTLGMHRSIMRRDFLNGVAIGIAGSYVAAKVTNVTTMGGCVDCHKRNEVSTGCVTCHEGLSSQLRLGNRSEASEQDAAIRIELSAAEHHFCARRLSHQYSSSRNSHEFGFSSRPPKISCTARYP